MDKLRNVETITEYASLVFGVTLDEIKSTARTQRFVLARQAVYLIAREELGLSYPQIARHFGGKDHTTIMHGVRKLNGLVEHDEKLAAKIQYIRDAVNGLPRVELPRIEPEVVKIKEPVRRKRDMTFDELTELSESDHAEAMREGSRNLLIALVGNMAA